MRACNPANYYDFGKVTKKTMTGEMTLREFLELARKNAPQGFQIKRYPCGAIIARPDKEK